MFYKKSRAKIGNKYKWFPRAAVLGRPAGIDDLARLISRGSTASPGDVHLVLRALPEAMAFFMENGRSVHITGLGSFYFKLSCAGRGADTPEEVSIEQVKAIRVQFIPERRKDTGKYTRPLVGKMELIELGGEDAGSTPDSGREADGREGE